MDETYAALVKEARRDLVQGAIDTANMILRRHSPRNVICSWCENNDANQIQVTKIDKASGSVTEIKCRRCSKLSYVCHGRCYCYRNSSSTCVESTYKEKMRDTASQQYSKSILMCGVLEATLTVLLSQGENGYIVCSCRKPIHQAHQICVTDVDRCGFITRVNCPNCSNEIAFSSLEESYVVQMLYHEQSDQDDVIERARNREYVENIRELCIFLRRHSFYYTICAECINDDQESCRVVSIDKQTGKVNEVEFLVPDYNQNLIITCRSGCYYSKFPLSTADARSVFETSYKEKVTNCLQANKPRSGKAILSCTVLAGTAAILRRHSIDNTLCQNCKNDDHRFLEVKEIDDLGFITIVKCVNCRQSMHADQSTECHSSPFYYEEIDESLSLNRGDHISWHRGYLLWHHAVVTRVDDESVAFAEYTDDRRCHFKLKETTQRRRDISPAYCSGIPYRITYEDSYTNEYAALRAERSIGEERYHPTKRNCEHVSYWCKTGLRESDQVVTLSRSVLKTFFAYFLRFLNMGLLIAFQMIHTELEGIQKDPKAFELFERILVYVYMSIVFVLFLVWSLYVECKKLKPYINNCCCNRPPCVACGLFLRIFTRELVAAVGPFLLIWFEDEIHPQASKWKRMLLIVGYFLLAFIFSYVIGAFLGIVIEHYSRRCSKCLQKHPCIRREPLGENQEATELQEPGDNRDTANLTENAE